MRRLTPPWCAIACVIAASCVSYGPPHYQGLAAIPDTAAEHSWDAAGAALRHLRTTVVNTNNYRALGFSSVDQAGVAKIGFPLVMAFVRLDSLRAYDSTKAPIHLLRGGDKVLVPVLVGGYVRSSVVVARQGTGWRPVAYGGSSAAQRIWQVLDSTTSTADQRASRILVEVNALALQFLAYDGHQGELMVVPLRDDPQGRWLARDTLPARAVFSKLVADAQHVDTLYPH